MSSPVSEADRSSKREETREALDPPEALPIERSCSVPNYSFRKLSFCSNFSFSSLTVIIETRTMYWVDLLSSTLGTDSSDCFPERMMMMLMKEPLITRPIRDQLRKSRVDKSRLNEFPFSAWKEVLVPGPAIPSPCPFWRRLPELWSCSKIFSDAYGTFPSSCHPQSPSCSLPM